MDRAHFRIIILLSIAFALNLTWSMQAPAGQFYIIGISSRLGTDLGERVMVRASSRAKYMGAVDATDTHWQLGASVRPSFGSWHHGSPKNGGNITANMTIWCDDNSCGGNAYVDKCTSGGSDNAYTYKGEVAISHNTGGNETDNQSSIGYVDCPPGGGNNGGGGPHDPDETDDPTSPILIDVARDHYQLTGLSDAVAFDIDGDGDEEMLGWTEATSDDAFLALDRNGNGVIDSGKELFGNFTSQPPSPSPNGFAALAVLDLEEHGGNGDGKISPADLAFYLLLLWTDSNHDGYSQSGELAPLSASEIELIDLRFVENGQHDQHGNWFRWKSKVHFQQGRKFAATDVIFVTEG